MTCHPAEEWPNLLILAVAPPTLHAVRNPAADDASEVQEGDMCACSSQEQIVLVSLQL